MLKCGVSKISIVPPEDIGNTYLAGYLTMMAPKITGIHDQIYTRALVLNDGKKKIALVSVECIGLLNDFIERIRYRLNAYGYLRKNIFIFSTHTHAGPDTMGLWGPIIGKSGINEKYSIFLVDCIVSAVLQAEGSLSEVKVTYTNSEISPLIENYRKDEEIDANIHLLKFSSNNSLIGCIWTYNAQPEITTRENTLISGDYPGLVCKYIENDFGGIALYAMGLCGSQSPIYCEEGFEKMELFAKEVFKEISNVFDKNEEITIPRMEVREKIVRMELQNPNFQLLFDIGIFNRKLDNNTALTTISKLRLGKVDLVFIPGEPFPNLLKPIYEDNSEQHIITISQTNDSLGYFIPLEEYSLKPQVWVDNIEDGKFIGHETESIGQNSSEVVRKTVRDLFRYKNILAIGAHADDLTIWAGGTIKKLSDEGNNVICIRITDDYADCVGISKEKGIKRNRKESEKAYRKLGAIEVIHMDYPTDTLSIADYYELRGKLVYYIRKYKPDLVISFDLNGTDEENMDHIITARAVNEACWQSSFDLFYTRHFEKGLEIHAVGERYLFARNPTITNYYVDITDYIEDKINAINQQKTVMNNWFHQNKLLARANNLYIELLEEDVPNAIRVNLLVKLVYGETGGKYGVKYAEEFNKIDAGFLEDLADD